MHERTDGGHQHRLEAMIGALKETFGERALEVARRQSDLAKDDSAEAWQAIVTALGG